MQQNLDNLLNLQDDQYMEVALLQKKYEEGIINKGDFYKQLSEIRSRINALIKKTGGLQNQEK